MAATPPDLAPIRAQVYKDPRPKEHFDRFHERSRTRDPDCVYDVMRVVTSLYAWTFFRTRGQRGGEGPVARAGDPRAEPLLVHGPLLRRRVHPPARPLHGQVAALQAADAVDLHARRRVPGPPRLPGRGGVRHRARHPRPRRRDRHVLRGRAVADGGALRAAQARHRPAGARVRRARRARRDPRLRRRCATGAGAQFPQVRVRYGDAVRWDRRSRSRRATSSRPSRTRSSPRSGRSTPRSPEEFGDLRDVTVGGSSRSWRQVTRCGGAPDRTSGATNRRPTGPRPSPPSASPAPPRTPPAPSPSG